MKIGSLSEKLILYFVLLGIGAIMIVGAISFYSTKEALMSRTFDQLTSLRIVKKNQIEQFYADRMREITFLAGITPASLFGEGPGVGSILPGQYYRAYYLVGQDHVISSGLIIGTPGKTPPAIPPKLFRILRDSLAQNPVVIFDESIDPLTGEPCQFMATRFTGKGAGENQTGDILVLAISMEAINAIMLNNDPLSGMGLSGETYLVGPDFLMRSASRFQEKSMLRTVVNTSSAKEALAGKTGSLITNDYRNILVLSSYEKVRVPNLNWAILAEFDEQEAMVPIYETRTRILLISMIIIVIFFGFVLFISRRITKPLIRLKDATVNLGEGQYDIDLPVTTGDEIGLLTRSFNVMARQIKEKTTELQQERFGRMRSVFDGEEMERQRLSRELHDGIGQSLIAIKLRLENLLYQDGKDIRNSIQELKKYFDQIIDEVRRISNNLMPSVLEVFSIPIAFRNLFSETEEHSGLRIHFEAKGDFDDLDKKIKTYIYRLTQEALNNIVKHAEAKEVWVYLTREPDQLILVIRDNGKGFTPGTAMNEGGNGIHNMRERASLLQGRIEINSVPMKGTTITLNVPITYAYVKNQDFPRG
jgi:signal transduction histidine kinase